MILSTISSCSTPLDPPTPPLLQGAIAAGGWWNGGCPPASDIERQMEAGGPEAVSPNVTQRLAKLYPAGSHEAVLVHDLHNLGFGDPVPCADAPAIKSMTFRQTGDGIGVYRMFAVVAWQTTRSGNVVWIKAHVQFIGL